MARWRLASAQNSIITHHAENELILYILRRIMPDRLSHILQPMQPVKVKTAQLDRATKQMHMAVDKARQNCAVFGVDEACLGRR